MITKLEQQETPVKTPWETPVGKARQTPSDTIQSHSTALSLHQTPKAKRAKPHQTPSRATPPRFPYIKLRRQSAPITIRHTPEPSDRAFPTLNPEGKARQTPTDTPQSYPTALSLHRTPEAKRANHHQTPFKATPPRFPYTKF